MAKTEYDGSPVSVSPEKAFADAFDEMWSELKPGALRRVMSGGPGAAGGTVHIPKIPPSKAEVELAHDLVREMMRKQDSLVCSEAELAERAWKIVDAMRAEFEKRIK